MSETPPEEDPTKAELEQLRKEKAERIAAEQKAKDDELAALREFKSKAEKAPAPVKTKKEKEATEHAKPDPPKTEEKPKPKPKSKVSRRWFGGDDDE